MSIKKINSSLLILLSLIFLSFSFYVSAGNSSTTSNNIFLDSDQDGLTDEEERTYGTDPNNKDTDNDGYNDGVEIKSGYDPLKPAPGDKLVTAEKEISSQGGTATALEEENLTKKLAYEISQMSKQASENEGGQVDLEQIQSMINETIYPEDTEDTTELEPVVGEADLKIKKQDYGKYSEEKAFKKRKEDFIEYITSMFYVFSSNSPDPVESDDDFSSSINSISQKVMKAFTVRNPKDISELVESGEKMINQIKEVEVPEEMVDTHIEMLTFASYLKNIEDYITPNMADPVADIQKLSEITGVMSNMASLSSSIQGKLSEYGLIDDIGLINEKLKEMK